MSNLNVIKYEYLSRAIWQIEKIDEEALMCHPDLLEQVDFHLWECHELMDNIDKIYKPQLREVIQRFQNQSARIAA